MEAEDSLLPHVPIRYIFRSGRTRSRARVISKYAPFPRWGWPLLANVNSGFQPTTRANIPIWSGLLVVYATLFVPVLFSLMVAINILVWTKVRINHVFIFGASPSIPVRPCTDPTDRRIGHQVQDRLSGIPRGPFPTCLMGTLTDDSRSDSHNFTVNFMLCILVIILSDRFCGTKALAFGVARIQYFHFMQSLPNKSPAVKDVVHSTICGVVGFWAEES